MFGLGNKVFASNRLTYRVSKEQDKAAMRKVLSDSDVTRPSGFPPITSDKMMDSFYRDFARFKTGISIFLEDTYIGYIHIRKYQYKNPEYAEKQLVELGMVIGKDYQGKGYGTETLIFWTEYLKTKVDYIVSGFFVENTISKAMIEKAGYHFFDSYEMDFEELNEKKKIVDYIY